MKNRTEQHFISRRVVIMHGYIHTTKNNSFIANKNKVNEREGKHEKKEKRKIMK